MEAGEIDSPRLVLTIDQLDAAQLLYSDFRKSSYFPTRN